MAKLSLTKSIIQAVIVRAILAVHSFLTVWRTADVKNNDLYWLLGLTNILLLLELFIRVVKHEGQEGKWFSPCLFIFLVSTVPAIWFLELDRLDRYDSVVNSGNVSAKQEELSSISGVSVPIKLEADTWISVLEQGLLFLFIVGRWMLPRGKVTRDQLSQLLFVYLGIASDIMELFVIFEEPVIREDRILTYATLGVWSVSLLQFTLTLTATKNARKGRGVAIAPEDAPIKDNRSLCSRIFQSEIWSLMVSISIMDLPFVTIRLYALVRYRILTYGILFFTFKNLLMIFLLIYRMIIVCYNMSHDNKDDDVTDDDTLILRRSKVDVYSRPPGDKASVITEGDSPIKRGQFPTKHTDSPHNSTDNPSVPLDLDTFD
ncbi:transmembrane protein 26-like [Pecten maximus]|uniref:transmembrane protein 26-like n=1 Tax=Pecten maximus TaxID=6579 RepID=UPI001457F346|nr:transmembrane protein 26-like [Pecten maximus]